ncbi:putative subtilisin-like protease [Ophiocordyceps camponoti-saundersi (nom. inval.)]|nr:putative subtilisin-like protease [Ophiocordyceps camponoti-saundersi (nom. inval.)]
MFRLEHAFLLGLVAALPQISPSAGVAPTSTNQQQQQAESLPLSGFPRHVITLKPDLSDDVAKAHYEWLESLPPGDHGPSGPQGAYHYGRFRGYSGNFNDEAAEQIGSRDEARRHFNDPYQKSIEKNRVLEIGSIPGWTTQEEAPWGLSDVSPASSKTKDRYAYDPRAGNGTFAYVIDTGINSLHEDFGTRVVENVCLAKECESQKYQRTGRFQGDISCHGTHIAATIGGTKYGLAKQTHIIDVRIFSIHTRKGIRYTSTDKAAMQKALYWVLTDVETKGRQGKSVINYTAGKANANVCPPISHIQPDSFLLGPACDVEKFKTYKECKDFSIDPGLEQAFRDVFKAGILPVVAAGNLGLPAKWSSPNGLPEVITVGAIDKNHQEAGFSNFGPAVDILAPGVGIKSASCGGRQDAISLDGTSMAAPHVTGLALYLLSVSDIKTPKELKEAILEMAVDDVKVLKEGTFGLGKGKLHSRTPQGSLNHSRRRLGQLDSERSIGEPGSHPDKITPQFPLPCPS